MSQKPLKKSFNYECFRLKEKSDSLVKASLFPKINYRLQEIEKMKS